MAKDEPFDGWEAHVLSTIREDCVKTLEHIHNNLGRDSGKALSSQQCDDVKDCVKALCHIEQYMMGVTYTDKQR